MNKQLTPTQLKALRLIEAGYELSIDRGFLNGAMLQQGGTGNGGLTEKITLYTAGSLVRRGYVIMKYRKLGTTVYKLSNAGRTILAEKKDVTL